MDSPPKLRDIESSLLHGGVVFGLNRGVSTAPSSLASWMRSREAENSTPRRNLSPQTARHFGSLVALKCAGFSAVTLLVVGCSQAPEATRETTFLHQVVAPQIVRWGRGHDPYLNLSPVLKTRSYELICVLLQDSTIFDAGRLPGVSIRAYHSDFGTLVPGGHSALVVVSGGQAHSIVISERDILLNAPPSGRCVSASNARLERRHLANFSTPVAGLGDGNAD